MDRAIVLYTRVIQIYSTQVTAVWHYYDLIKSYSSMPHMDESMQPRRFAKPITQLPSAGAQNNAC